jgi:hypothetical protein
MPPVCFADGPLAGVIKEAGGKNPVAAMAITRSWQRLDDVNCSQPKKDKKANHIGDCRDENA